jgi:hypothetical protein
VEIEMYHVETHVAGARDAENGVGVRSIVVELPACFVDQPRNLQHLAIEEPQSIGVGHHDGSDIGSV